MRAQTELRICFYSALSDCAAKGVLQSKQVCGGEGLFGKMLRITK